MEHPTDSDGWHERLMTSLHDSGVAQPTRRSSVLPICALALVTSVLSVAYNPFHLEEIDIIPLIGENFFGGIFLLIIIVPLYLVTIPLKNYVRQLRAST